MMITFLPYYGTDYKNFRCVCEKTECKIISENYQKIHDARGGYFTIPSGRENEYTITKNELVMRYLGVSDVKKNSRIAVHHFDPLDLQNICCMKQNQSFLYKWRLASIASPKGTIEVVPWYTLDKAEKDYLAIRKVVEDGPTYTKAARKKTEEMVLLALSDSRKLSKEEKKKLSEFANYAKRQYSTGAPIAIEKMARLNQIGFNFDFGRTIANKKRKLNNDDPVANASSSNP